MITKQFNITHQWAAAKLEEHSKRLAAGTFRQRNIRERMIQKFADDMITGAWQLTHQGIAFDEDGNLLDGQHRLMAVVKANVPVQMNITTDLPRKAMDSLDCGATRSIANQLQVSHGYKNANITAAVARHVAVLALDALHPGHRYVTRPPMTTANTLWMLESLNLEAPTERALSIFSTNSLRAAYTIAPWAIYWKFNKEKAEDFLLKVQTLANLGVNHPSMQLYRYVTSSMLRPRRDELHIMRVVCYCIQMFDAGKPIERLRGATVRPSREAQLWLINLDKGRLGEAVCSRLIPGPKGNGAAGKKDLRK